jgi:hypothetical protein
MKAEMKAAVNELFEVAGGYEVATPEQILAVANAFSVEPWALEGFYFDEGAQAANE